MEEEALDSLIAELLPVAGLITPNIPEAEQLSGLRITSEAEMREAAAMIRKLGTRAVLIKGGHLGGDEAFAVSSESIDVLDDEGKVTVFRERRIPGAQLHGSGCILSSAIAAGLGKGMTLEDSIRRAKAFVWESIRDFAKGPLNQRAPQSGL